MAPYPEVFLKEISCFPITIDFGHNHFFGWGSLGKEATIQKFKRNSSITTDHTILISIFVGGFSSSYFLGISHSFIKDFL